MRAKFPALAVMLLVAGAPAAGLAQGINSSLGSDTSGVGVGPNGTGFDGAMGDPLWLASHPTLGAAPFSFYPPGHRTPTGPAGAPAPAGAPSHRPSAAPFGYYYTPPTR